MGGCHQPCKVSPPPPHTHTLLTTTITFTCPCIHISMIYHAFTFSLSLFLSLSHAEKWVAQEKGKKVSDLNTCCICICLSVCALFWASQQSSMTVLVKQSAKASLSVLSQSVIGSFTPWSPSLQHYNTTIVVLFKWNVTSLFPPPI